MKWFAQSSFFLAFALAACGQGDGAVSEPPAAPPSAAEETPSPTGFTGDWAANPAWCANTAGAERPIRISETRFEGYENGCDITAIDGVAGSWTATLACMAEGQQSTERVRMEVAGDEMQLSYLDRGGEPVSLTRCAA